MPLPVLLGDEDSTVTPGTTAATLVQRLRRFMGDWPENDALTASMTSVTPTATVADATLYQQGFLIQVDAEAMYVSAASGTTLTLRRGQRGSTATAHSSAATILVRPHFFDSEYLDALNAAIDATFPLLYQSHLDDSTTTTASSYEYTVPSVNGAPMMILSKLMFKENSDLTFREISNWEVLRGTTPRIKLRRALPVGTLRFYGFGPLPPLANLNDSLSGLFPVHAEDLLTMYASHYLLASGEARRVREDTGARDDRENANRLGGSLAASQGMLQRFYTRLQQSAMPPMPRHIKSVM